MPIHVHSGRVVRSARRVRNPRWAVTMKGFEQAHPEPDADRGYAKRAAQIPKHLSDQCSKLVVVDVTHQGFLLKRWHREGDSKNRRSRVAFYSAQDLRARKADIL